MRVRTIMAAAAVVLLAAPATAEAGQRPEPLDVRQATTVGRAADTNGLNGIYVSPFDGNVYVASVGGDEITVHNPQNGNVIDRIGPERGVRGPDDIFITDDGTIYWTEILTGHVGVLRPDGSFDRQFVGLGVNPITMSDDGRLFVGRLFFGSGLWELDADFVGAPVELDPTLNVNSFDFGPDGHLYAPSQFTGEILRIDVNVDPIVTEVVAAGFLSPTAAKFNSLGELHVGDFPAGQVVKVDLATGDRDVLIDIDGTFDNIAFGTDDRLYAAAGSDNQIIRYDSGRVKALSQPGLGSNGGVAVSPDGTVWVAEFFAMRGFDKNPQKWATSFYNNGPPDTSFAGASTVAPDGDNLIITSGFSNSVQVLDPATGAILFNTNGLAAPTNAIRHGDTLVAAQVGVPGLIPASVVNAEDPTEVFLDGAFLPLFVPLGLASDGDTLYVGDWATGLVWAIDGSGPTVLAALEPANADGGLEGLAVDGDRLLAVEVGRRQVTAIDLATGEQSAAIVGLDFSDRVPEGSFPYGFMSGVAVGPDNSIYVSDDGVNSVYRFRRPG